MSCSHSFIHAEKKYPHPIWCGFFAIVMSAGIWTLASHALRAAMGLDGISSAWPGISYQVPYLVEFGGSLFGLWFVVTRVGLQQFRRVITARPKVSATLFTVGFAIAAASIVALDSLAAFVGFEGAMAGIEYRVPLTSWQWWSLGFAMPSIFLQCLFEEAWFRGVLPQTVHQVLKARSTTANSAAFLSMLICAIIFGAAHFGYRPTGIALGWLMIPAVLVLHGAVFLRAMCLTGGIELSLGLHFANNLACLSSTKLVWEEVNTSATLSDILVSVAMPLTWLLAVETVAHFVGDRFGSVPGDVKQLAR